MKNISEHLGQIIIVLAVIALLIGTVGVFATPIGNFFYSIVNKENALGGDILDGIGNVNLTPGSAYKIIKGYGQTYTTGTLSFTSNAPFNKFAGVKVNGELVDPIHYTVTEGSTIVTFTEAYSQTLAASDNYSIEILASDGQAEAPFTVATPTAFGEKYETDDYIYTFGTCSNLSEGHGGAEHLYTWEGDERVGLGWHVIVKDRTKTSYEPIKDQINGYPIVCMCECFAGCENLVNSPAIPASVKCLQYCYGVRYDYATDTSTYCNSLTGEITLPDIEGTANVPYAQYDPWKNSTPSTGIWDGSGSSSGGPLHSMLFGKQSGEPVIVKYTTKCGAVETDYQFANSYDPNLIVKKCIDGEKATVTMTLTQVFTGRYVELNGYKYVYVTEQDYTAAGFLAIDDGTTALPNPLPSDVYGYPVIGTYEEVDNLPTQTTYSGVVQYTFNPYLGRYQIARIGRVSEAPAEALENTVNGYPATGLKEYFAGQLPQNRTLTYGGIVYSWNTDTECFSVPADQYESATRVIYGYAVNSAS